MQDATGSAETKTGDAIEKIAARIRSGEYQVGQTLPAKRELAPELGISVATLDRVYDELVRRGLIKTLRGKGTVVLARTAEEAVTLDKLAACVDSLRNEVVDLARRVSDLERRDRP